MKLSNVNEVVRLKNELQRLEKTLTQYGSWSLRLCSNESFSIDVSVDFAHDYISKRLSDIEGQLSDLGVEVD